MISFGLTMQDRANELPAEVAIWLLERNDRYPGVDFRVEYWDVHDDDVEEHTKKWQRFSRLLRLRGRNEPLMICFMYPRQKWGVRIIALLTPEKRREIAQMPEYAEEISRDDYGVTLGIPLKSNEAPNDRVEFVPVEPHMYMTSSLSMSGAELLDLVSGSRDKHKDAILKAMSEKSWDEAKKLLKQHR